MEAKESSPVRSRCHSLPHSTRQHALSHALLVDRTRWNLLVVLFCSFVGVVALSHSLSSPLAAGMGWRATFAEYAPLLFSLLFCFVAAYCPLSRRV